MNNASLMAIITVAMEDYIKQSKLEPSSPGIYYAQGNYHYGEIAGLKENNDIIIKLNDYFEWWSPSNPTDKSGCSKKLSQMIIDTSHSN